MSVTGLDLYLGMYFSGNPDIHDSKHILYPNLTQSSHIDIRNKLQIPHKGITYSAFHLTIERM